MSVADHSWPRWQNDNPMFNLREVAPGLWIGAYKSPRTPPSGCDLWGGIADFYGTSRTWDAGVVLKRGFEDGWPFPDGTLDDVEDLLWRARAVGRPVLLHCAAGASRSVSAAYAMLRVVYGLSHEEALRRAKEDEDSEYPVKETLRSAMKWVAEHS